jgi:hypothetical protein
MLKITRIIIITFAKDLNSLCIDGALKGLLFVTLFCCVKTRSALASELVFTHHWTRMHVENVLKSVKKITSSRSFVMCNE